MRSRPIIPFSHSAGFVPGVHQRLRGASRAFVVGLALFLSVGLMTVSSTADAKRRRRKARGPIKIAVLPFEGMGVAGGVMRESLEIELELLEMIRLQSSASAARSVVRNGKRAFQSKKLRATMKKAQLDALVQGIQMDGEVVMVAVYGADGRARFAEFFDRGDDIDSLAAKIVETVTPVLKKFSSARTVKVPTGPPKADAQVVRDRDPIDDTDLFVDLEESPKKAKKKKKKKKVREPKRRAERDDDDDSGRRTILGGEPEADAPDDIDDERPKRRFKRSSRDDDDRGLSGSSRPKRTLKKVEGGDDDDAETGGFFQPGPLTPMFSVMVAGQGGAWLYDFDGKVPDQSYGFNAYFPGGSARVAFWPMQYFGVEVDAGGDYMSFKFEQPANGEGITPGEFAVPHITAGAAARARYILELGESFGVGIGLRVGYRFDFVGVEPQTITTGGATSTVTIVPGYQLHALVLGPEFYVPFKIGSNKFQIQLSTEINPGLSSHQELPDSPGNNSVVFGGGGHLFVRAELFAGLFAQVGAYANVTIANYPDKGNRLSPVTNLDGGRDELEGGSVSSTNAGGRIGLGWQF